MLEHIIIAELFILGIYISTRKGMIFGWISRIAEHKIYLLRSKFETQNLARKTAYKKGWSKSQNPKLNRQYSRLVFLETKANKKLKRFFIILSPTLICITCMASTFGSIYFFLQMNTNFQDWATLILSTSGLSFILSPYTSKL